MTIPTIDRETHTFSFWSKWYVLSKLFTLIMLFGLIGFDLLLYRAEFHGVAIRPSEERKYQVILLALVIWVVIVLAIMIRRRKTRIEVQGDKIRLYTDNIAPKVEQSFRNVASLTIRIKGGAIGIASWRRIDFVNGESIIFDGQVVAVEKLEDLITERSGKQFLRWLTGEAYQKPKA